LNLQGKRLVPDLITAIRDRYQFLRSPLPKLEELDETAGIKFSEGKFKKGDSDLRIALEIYKDGLIAETRLDTDSADAVLDDLFAWMGQQFGLKNESHILKEIGRAHV